MLSPDPNSLSSLSSLSTAPAVYVSHFGYALGDQAFTVEQTGADGLLVSEASALRRAGFEQHYRAAPGTGSLELARRAVSPIEAMARRANALLYATALPGNGSAGGEAEFRATRDVRHLMRFPAGLLQAELGLHDALVMGLSQQGCTSLHGAIWLARRLLCADLSLDPILCVTADRIPEGALYEAAHNLVSDAAACCIVSRQPGGFRLLAERGLTNGALIAASDEETVGSFFSYMVRIINETLHEAQLGIGDIHWIIPQNTHHVAWRILCSLLGYDNERVLFPTLAKVGHAHSADCIINLDAVLAQGRLQPGERILVPMAGFGLTWQCLLLEMVAP